MRALRIAANLARKHDSCIMISSPSCVSNPVASSKNLGHLHGKDWKDHHAYGLCIRPWKFFIEPLFPTMSSLTPRKISSQAGEMTSHKFNVEVFPDLEATLDNDKRSDIMDEVNCGKVVHDNLPEIASKDNSKERSEKWSRERDMTCPLLMALMKAPRNSVSIALNEWVKQGNALERSDITVAMIHLRRRRLYDKALQGHPSSVIMCRSLFRANRVFIVSLKLSIASDQPVIAPVELFQTNQPYLTPLHSVLSKSLMNLLKICSGLWPGSVQQNQFVEWLEVTKALNFAERDYASHLDLIAKKHGLQEAEIYIDRIPEAFRGEVVYRTLLANCVSAVNVQKAEKVFSRMRDVGLSISTFAYNQLLLLYRRIGRNKIPDILLMMEKDNIKPSLFTYTILIDAKGLSRDITGMEKIVESMRDEGVVPDNALRAMVARHYISEGINEKAEAILKEMEGDCVRENTDAWKFLLLLYASLGKADDVKKAWKSCEASASIDEFISAIEAWGKLGLIEDAEEAFERMRKKWEKIPPRCYNALLNVYANHNLLSKGKDLAMKMSDAGCWIGALTWDALVKLFAAAGEVEKADSVLQKAAQGSGTRPLYSSYMTVLDKYAELGDVHNAERMLHMLRQAKYPSRVRQYEILAIAYKNAKTPAYGLRERMKADNVYPDKKLLAQLLSLSNL